MLHELLIGDTIIKLAADGFENHEIARALNLSIHTVTDRLIEAMAGSIAVAFDNARAFARAQRHLGP